MTLEIQFQLKNNHNYLKYIREHSYWYKLLNRNPDLFKQFEEEVKEAYGLRPLDKLNRVMESIELVSSLFSTLR